MNRLHWLLLIAPVLLHAQTCQITAVAGKLASAPQFPAAANEFNPTANQLAVTAAGQLLFTNQTGNPGNAQVLELDGRIVNQWSQPFASLNGTLQAFIPAPDGTILTALGNQVLKLHTDGTVDTVAGTSQAGFSGDGGPASLAELNAPTALALMADGSLLVADNGNYRIRRISPTQTITTIAGNGGGDPTIGDGGPAIYARIGTVASMVVLQTGEIYFAEGGYGSYKLREIKLDATLVTLASGLNGLPSTTDNVPVASASFVNLLVLAAGPDDLLYLLDGQTIRRLNNGVLSIVRTHPPGSIPGNFAIAPDGSFYLYVPSSGSIIHRTAEGAETIVVGSDPSAALDGIPASLIPIVPRGVVAGPDGLAYFVDVNSDSVLRIQSDGSLHVVFHQTQPPINGYPTDTLQSAQRFSFDPAGNIVFASGGILYRATLAGTVTILAGGGTDQTVNYDGPATGLSGFFTTTRPLIFPDGTIYAVDVRRSALVRITTDGRATVVWVSPSGTPNSPPTFGLGDGSELSMSSDGSILASGGGGLAKMEPPNYQVIFSTAYINGPEGFPNALAITDFFEDGSGDIVFLGGGLYSRLSNGDLAQYAVNAQRFIGTQANGLGTGGVLAPDGHGNIYFIDSNNNQVDVLANYSACTSSTTPILTANPLPYPLGPGWAPGTPVTVVGINLGPGSGITTTPDSNGFYPFQTGGVQVTVNNVPAPILSAQSTSLTFQIPYGMTIPATSAGSTTNSNVVVTYRGFASNPLNFSLVPTSISLLPSGNPAPVNPYVNIANALVRNQDGSMNSPANPAAAGSIIGIIFSGVGELNPPRQTGENPWFPMRQALASTAVYYQNQYLTVAWSGEVPGQPGMYQVNVVVPEWGGIFTPTLTAGTAAAIFYVYAGAK